VGLTGNMKKLSDKSADDYQYHYIYKNTCKITGKFYVGLHSTNNLNDGYYGSGKILIKSVKKYGINNHIIEILEFLPSRVELSIRESEIVNSDFLKDPMCMNIKIGGFAGSHIDKTKKSISMSLSKSYNEIYGDKEGQLQKGKRKLGALDQWDKYNDSDKTNISNNISNGLKKHYSETQYISTDYICPHCLKDGKGPAMFKHHFDNCPSLTGIIRCMSKETKEKIKKKLTGRIPPNKGKIYDRINCPHCEKSVAVIFANVYHFDKCRFKM
jgi:hypothetical protein